MSKLTQYLDRPASVTADVVISIACGVVAYIVLGLITGFFGDLGGAVQTAGAGVTGAAVYIRARNNLLDNAPAGFKQNPG